MQKLITPIEPRYGVAGKNNYIVGTLSWGKLTLIELIATRKAVAERGCILLEVEAICDAKNQVYFGAKITFYQHINTNNPMQIAVAFGILYNHHYEILLAESDALGNIDAFASKHGIDLKTFEPFIAKR